MIYDIIWYIYKEPLQSIKEFIKAFKLGDYLHVGGWVGGGTKNTLVIGCNSSSVIEFVDIESLLNSLCYKSAFFSSG